MAGTAADWKDLVATYHDPSLSKHQVTPDGASSAAQPQPTSSVVTLPMPPHEVIAQLEGALQAGHPREAVLTAGIEALHPWSAAQRFELLREATAQQSLLVVEAQ